MEKKKCQVCGEIAEHIKKGFTPNGSQKYKCQSCGKVYTPEPKKYEYSEEERTSAIKYYLEGNSGRSTGRYFGMSKANVVRWIKERAAKLPEPDAQTAEKSEESVEVIELDEMFHYVKKRDDRNERKYICKPRGNAQSATNRRIYGNRIAFGHTNARLDCSPAAETYYSDGFLMYRDLCYWGVHAVAPQKSQTYTVEGVNSDLRRYIAGFARRSKCFYRKIETVKAILTVFVSAYNRFGEYKRKHQVLAKHKSTSTSRLHKYSDLPLALIDFIA